MGIEKHGIKFLLRSIKRHGLSLQETIMLGRQGLHSHKEELSKLLATPDVAPLFRTGYAEDLLFSLGATTVHSLDASHYEGATHVHDLNLPIPVEMHAKYSAVIDGGTQEHIFDLPASLKNSINLLKKGGHLLIMTPANNFFGHGYYQFSPELFDSVLGHHNGMELVEMIATESFEDEMRWFQVQKPSELGRRVTLRSHFSVMLLVIAKKISEDSITNITAMQSDYEVAWDDSAKAADIHAQSAPQNGVRSKMVRIAKKLVRNVIYPNRLAKDPSAFKELPDDN